MMPSEQSSYRSIVMHNAAAQAKGETPSFSSDESRWQAIVDRDPAADGAFFYSVRTTGVYCRPTCAARMPLWQNVRFHATCTEAQRAGFRPCKRCKPSESSITQRHASIVAEACRIIENA